MDGIVLLKDDHKAVEGMFKQFEKGKGSALPAAKRNLVEQMTGELTAHMFIEETIFYPAARRDAPDTSERVLEGVEENHVVVWLLSELQNLGADDETYDPKVAVMMENFRHHVHEEEQDWFPQVRKALGRNRLVELGDRMAAAKNDAPSDPMKLRSASQ